MIYNWFDAFQYHSVQRSAHSEPRATQSQLKWIEKCPYFWLGKTEEYKIWHRTCVYALCAANDTHTGTRGARGGKNINCRCRKSTWKRCCKCLWPQNRSIEQFCYMRRAPWASSATPSARQLCRGASTNHSLCIRYVATLAVIDNINLDAQGQVAPYKCSQPIHIVWCTPDRTLMRSLLRERRRKKRILSAQMIYIVFESCIWCGMSRLESWAANLRSDQRQPGCTIDITDHSARACMGSLAHPPHARNGLSYRTNAFIFAQ